MFGQFEASTCYEAKCDRGFIGISGGLGFWKPNSPFVLVDPKWPCLHPKHDVLEGISLAHLTPSSDPKRSLAGS